MVRLRSDVRTNEIRSRFLEFFQARDHALVDSASLISEDKSLLFTVAGMVPFVPYMLGEVPPPWQRATSVQKCVRTGDIEEVGKTTRHLTFFQMNGNFSFGDYFKQGAIELAWEFVTGAQQDGNLGFDQDKVWVTVFQDDDEAARLWREVAGLPAERIQRRGIKDNFWSTGQPGPAGPCSEIYIDRGPNYGAEGGPVVDEDRFLEIWNLVFMEVERGAGGAKENYPILGELDKKNIDTGMGLERVALLLQGADNIYEIDEVLPVINCAENLSGRRYGSEPAADVRLRVVADHVRAGLMLIGDGVTPSNEARGYVLRRLLRRAIFSMRLLGVTDPVFPELFTTAKNAMAASYPHLEAEWDRISATAYREEEAFRRTLTGGSAILDLAIERARAKAAAMLDGAAAFQLHDTYGFPIDLTLEIASDQGLAVDQQGFTDLMRQQRERARADAAAKKTGHAETAVYQELAQQGGPTSFTGYDQSENRATVVALLQDGQPVPMATAPANVEVILDATPFYGEAGGQLADQGVIELDSGAVIDVDDVQRPLSRLYVHHGRLLEGTVAVGESGLARIDRSRRLAITRAHTATHLVHQVLREELGSTAQQAGSENSPGRMRFDFRYGQGLSEATMSQIEGRTNQLLAEDLEVTNQVMPLDQARQLGAIALFGEKYGEQVRVVKIGGDWSIELCGGTHLERTGQLGRVSLLGESSIGSGIRRIEALVGDSAYQHQAKEHALVAQLTDLLKVHPDQLTDRISQLVSRLKQADKELAALRGQRVLAAAKALAQGARQLGPTRLVTARVEDGTLADDLRALALDVRERLGANQPAVVAVGSKDPATGRAAVVVALNQMAVELGLKAGNLIKTASRVLGGGGGGKPELAQGSGADGEALDKAWAGIVDDIEGS